MKTDKKQLLVISSQSALITHLKNNLSVHCDISSVNSMHSGYTMAVDILPDIIFIDQTSLAPKSLKNVSNFKSTHFLNKCWLVMYADENLKQGIEIEYKDNVDEIIYATASLDFLFSRVIQQVHSKFCIKCARFVCIETRRLFTG